MGVTPIRRVPKFQSPYSETILNGVKWAQAAEVSHAITVTATFGDTVSNPLAVPVAVPWYISSDAAGLIPITSAPSGGVVGGASGNVIVYVTGKAGLAICTTAGLLTFVVTNSTAATYYIVIVLPDGTLAVSPAIAIT